MKLQFYFSSVDLISIFERHFFYYPKKENIKFPRDGPLETPAIGPVDLSKPLEVEHVVEVLKQIYYNGYNLKNDMFYPTYFFDPIHGYCKCNDIVNNYKKHIHDTRICPCTTQIEFNGKTNLFQVTLEEHNEASAKGASFPKGFREVLYVEPLIIFEAQMYLVCSLNVMNVKPVEKNTYDIGIEYDFVYDFYTYRLQKRDIYATPQSRLGHLKEQALRRYEIDIKRYEDKCMCLIKDWISKGLIPQDKYYVHIYNLDLNSNLGEGRIYISTSDYNACQKYFQESQSQKKKKK